MKSAVPTYSQANLFGNNRFHNPIAAETDEKLLQGYEQAAQHQDQRILAFMKSHVRKEGYTSAEIASRFPNMLETSVRRSLSNLSNERKVEVVEIVNTGTLRKGARGRNLIVWQFKSNAI